MSKRELLDQARRGISMQIDESPTVVLIETVPLISDGFGGLMPDPDPSATVIEASYRARISHERAGVQKDSVTPTGLDTNLTMWLLTEWRNVPTEGHAFEAVGKSWRIGPVDTLQRFGGVIAYQAPLYASEAVPEPVVST